ncbi:MAG TPA: glutathione peroxidase [Spongiibacteraceae bacterium]|nr:glutathione peroxidase [Spongiibacteraceae bacterium]
MTTIYDFDAITIDGKDTTLANYRGKLVLIVNVASKCGLTPQYEGLEKLYEKYKDKDFVILGFPCNQFRGQEPGSENEIQEFCSTTYGVKFPLFSKIDVNGPDAHPLYQFLREQQPGEVVTPAIIEENPFYQFLHTNHPENLQGGAIKWNFTKFLIGRDGRVLKRFEPKTLPEEIEQEIQPLLN